MSAATLKQAEALEEQKTPLVAVVAPVTAPAAGALTTAPPGAAPAALAAAVPGVTAEGEKKDARTQGDFTRAFAYIQKFKDLPDDSPVKQAFRCFLKWGVKPLIIICMGYIWVCKKLYAIYKMLPMNVIQMIFGVVLCFFGGVYFASLAAVEAAINLGGVDLFTHLSTCWEEASNVGVASQKDDELDANANGIKDVEEMSTNDLINHKAKVALMAVKDPQRLQQAMVALGNVYIAVIATLKFKFARTVAISLGIANMLTLPACRIFGPFLAAMMGPDLNHWVPTIIDTCMKFIAVTIATYIQKFISAFYSGLRGGRMFALGAINIATAHGWMDKMPDWLASKPFDPDTSYLDECIAYPLAAAGFYVQVMMGFTCMFPLNLVLFPLTLIEWFLEWQVYT